MCLIRPAICSGGKLSEELVASLRAGGGNVMGRQIATWSFTLSQFGG